MGSSILSGLQSGADVSKLLSNGQGSNLSTYGSAGKATAIVGTGAAITGSVAGATTWAGLIATVLGPITLAFGAALMIVSRIFKGADPYQVDASEVEQAFEGAVQNFKALDFAGYMSPQEASTAISTMLKAGTTYYNAVIQKQEAARASDYILKPLRDGLAHMTAIIGGDVQNPFTEKWPSLPLKPWDESAASGVYIKGGVGTWYPSSVAAAAKLTNGYMSQLRSSAAQKAAAAVTGAVSTTGSKLKIVAIGGAVLAAAMHFL